MTVDEYDDAVYMSAGGATLKKTSVKTLPYPGFPTDMHPQMTALLCTIDGTSYINESIYENRFRYVEELKRMGAKLKIDGRLLAIEGGPQLVGAPVVATDLRGGIAIIIAGLTAKGRTEISEISLIKRGYDDICSKLSSIGANIKRITVPDQADGQAAN